MDINRFYEKKLKAVAAYRSQLYSKTEKKVNTYIASKYFFDIINSRHKYSGLKVMSEYGEPYYTEFDIKIDDPIDFFKYLQ